MIQCFEIMSESVFTLLDSELRRKILELLAGRRMTFTELMDSLEITNTGNLCHHLRALRGYVSSTDDGYTVTPMGLSLLKAARRLNTSTKNPCGDSEDEGSDNRSQKPPDLRQMRKVARATCDDLLEERDDVLAVCVTEDVAWGKVEPGSVVNLGVFLEPKKNTELPDYAPQSIELEDIIIDIGYTTFKEGLMELDIYYGTDWEIASSMMEDCMILYDPSGGLKKIKKNNKGYPVEMRKRNTRYLNEKRLEANEVLWRYYLSQELEMLKVFAAVSAIQSMRLVYPICGEKMRTEITLIEDAHRMVGSVELKDNWEHLIKPSLLVTIPDRDEVCRRLLNIKNSINKLAEEHGMMEALNHPSELHLDFFS